MASCKVMALDTIRATNMAISQGARGSNDRDRQQQDEGESDVHDMDELDCSVANEDHHQQQDVTDANPEQWHAEAIWQLAAIGEHSKHHGDGKDNRQQEQEVGGSSPFD